MKYEVQVTRVQKYILEIEAESEDEAENIVTATIENDPKGTVDGEHIGIEVL